MEAVGSFMNNEYLSFGNQRFLAINLLTVASENVRRFQTNHEKANGKFRWIICSESL